MAGNRGRKPEPLVGLGSARRCLKYVFETRKDPVKRAHEMTKLLYRANLAKEPDAKVLKLIERARIRELERAQRSGKASVKKFSFTQDYKGKQFKFIDERIRAKFESGDFGGAYADLLAVAEFARKHNCREYAGEYFGDLAVRIKGKILAENPVVLQIGRYWPRAKELFFKSLEHSIELFKEAGNLHAAQNVESYLTYMRKLL